MEVYESMNWLTRETRSAVVWSVMAAAMTAVVGCGAKEAPQATYSVKAYDPTRNPAADLAATVENAKATNKRILIQVGGQWCGWCHELDKYIAEHGAVAAELRDHFIIMKVNYSDENENADFLAGYPNIPGYPHLFVLESGG